MFPRSLDSLLLRLVVQLSAFETPFRSPPLFSSQAAAFLLFRLACECPRACTPRLHPAPGKVGLTPGSGPRALASLTVVRPSLTLHHSFSPTWLLSERGLTASVLEAPAHAPLPEGPPLRPAGEAARPPSRLSARLGAAWQGVHLFRRSRFTHSKSRWVTDSRDSARFVQGCVSRARTRGGLRAGAAPPVGHSGCESSANPARAPGPRQWPWEGRHGPLSHHR